MRCTVLRQLLNIFAILLIATTGFAQDAFYDELRTGEGSLRPQYQIMSSYLNQQTPPQVRKYLAWSRKEFSGDNALDPLPRILTGNEYDELKAGVEQRALALQLFLKDHYSGQKTYAKAGVISEQTVDRIISRSGESGYKGLVSPKIISFMYGPDIIRDALGQWRVIEDNPGFIGGLGDLKIAYDLTLRSYEGLEKNLKLRKPLEFYKKIASSYKQRAAEFGGKAILYMTPPYADNEDQRIQELFAQQGIETITPESKKKLVIKNSGAYLQYQNKNQEAVLEKVGFVFLNGEHAWLDSSHPAAKQRNLLEAAATYVKEEGADPEDVNKIKSILASADRETHLPNLKKLKKIFKRNQYIESETPYAKGLNRLILEKKVATNYSPGVDFIGDKEFYVYIEELIRYYLKQEPLIKNIETARFANSEGQLDEVLLKRTFKSLDQYVIKRVDGRGGDAVWVGPKIKPKEIPELMALIRENPEVYITQKYTALSRMNDNIVDLRVITDVAPDKITVTDTPWGRGLPREGNGKVNLSDKGREITVLVTDSYQSPVRCERVF